MNLNKLLPSAAVALAVIGLSTPVHAIPQLRIFDGTTTITITDNAAGDLNAIPGVVTWSGAVGVWIVNVDTGLTKPNTGSAIFPVMDLNFVDQSNAAGTLTLSFTETDFGPVSPGGISAQIGGTTFGTVSYRTYGGNSNTAFDTSNLLTTQGPFGAGAFSGSTTGGSLGAVNPFSLTQVVTITHLGVAVSSGDANITRVPDSGTSILLLGAGLLMLGLFARSRKHSA